MYICEPGLLGKLDIEKAYDLVSWMLFLWLLLCRMGFDENWIKTCVSMASFYIFINDRSSGLSQGDLVSPFFFNIVMQAFGRLIWRAVLKEISSKAFGLRGVGKGGIAFLICVMPMMQSFSLELRRINLDT